MYLPGTKRVFDVGVYVLIERQRPVVYSVYRPWLIRVCNQDASELDDVLRREPARMAVGSNYTTVFEIPVMQPHLRTCDGAADCAVALSLRGRGIDSRGIWEKMLRIIRCTVRFESELWVNDVLPAGVVPFELLRFDFLLNRESGSPSLSEVNMSPELRWRHVKNDYALKTSLVEDMMCIVHQRPCVRAFQQRWQRFVPKFTHKGSQALTARTHR
jgi:hypothetical protein